MVLVAIVDLCWYVSYENTELRTTIIVLVTEHSRHKNLNNWLPFHTKKHCIDIDLSLRPNQEGIAFFIIIIF